MYVLAHEQIVEKYPYSINQLKQNNPQTSFPAAPSTELLKSYGIYEVVQADYPTYDSATYRIEEGVPMLVGSVWTQVWNVIALTAEEIAQQAAQIKAQRAEAYRTESDPLFFKAQRGEATQQQWLDKIAEIKVRYPN